MTAGRHFCTGERTVLRDEVDSIVTHCCSHLAGGKVALRRTAAAIHFTAKAVVAAMEQI